MRLNKWIAYNTQFSRREADELIKNHKVKLNHKIATFGDIVFNQKVFINGREIRPKDTSKYSVIVYHKQKNELVSKSDDRGRKVIYDTLESKFRYYIPVGRLDFASSGLLLLTDNAEIATKLMMSNLVRVYNLKLNGRINQKVIDAMNEGLSLSDASAGAHKYSHIKSMDFAPFDFFKIIKESDTWVKLKVGIIEGKNRELRRFFAYFNLDVIELKRVSYGFINLNALPSGKSRYLSRSDYNKLRAFLNDFDKNIKVVNANRNKRK